MLQTHILWVLASYVKTLLEILYFSSLKASSQLWNCYLTNILLFLPWNSIAIITLHYSSSLPSANIPRLFIDFQNHTHHKMSIIPSIPMALILMHFCQPFTSTVLGSSFLKTELNSIIHIVEYLCLATTTVSFLCSFPCLWLLPLSW